jgi:chaperonin GroES
MNKPIDKLLALTQESNIASKLDDQQLAAMGEQVVSNYEVDRKSRSEWEKRCEEAIKFCKQMVPKKTFPWAGASNVVFPLLTTAANSFAARTYPEIVKDGDHLVKFNVSGEDPDGSKQLRANRLSKFISWQLLVEGDSWETDLDKLLHQLPIVGTCFRKQYFDSRLNIPCSDLCNIADIVVNNNVPSLEKAHRISHRVYLSKNDIIEKMRSGLYIDLDVKDLEKSQGTEHTIDTDLDHNMFDPNDSNPMYECIEQHTYFDLDGDDYEEPYIIFVHIASKKVLGLYPRFDPYTDISLSDKEEITYIKPKHHFTDYHFIHDPDGGFYSLGFGHILYPVNKAINSLMNQLIDSGTLANTNSGIFSRQLRLKGGNIKLHLGEFVQADAGTTGRIADSIYQFQFKDPSPVLLNLLSLLIESAKEMASINDIMSGTALPQNAATGATSEIAQNGLKMFNSISLRLYRSLKKEFKIIYDLNKSSITDEVYFNYNDSKNAIAKSDFEDTSLDIIPVADPKMDSSSQKLMQANSLLLLMQNPAVTNFVNVPNALIEYFRALGVKEESITNMVVVPDPNNPPPPDPKMIEAQVKAQQSMIDNQIKMEQETTKRMGLQVKASEIDRKYKIKENESDEKSAKMLADVVLKQATAQHMSQKLDIENKKVDAMLNNKAHKEKDDND